MSNEGAAQGRVASEVNPDGSWTLYAYDSAGRVASEIEPFGDAAPVLDAKNAVIGYNGVVRRATYSYDPVDSRDDGTLSPSTARATVVCIGNDAEGWTETSRRYYAECLVADANAVTQRVVVAERAAVPGAAYGATDSLRTTTWYNWRNENAGRVSTISLSTCSTRLIPDTESLPLCHTATLRLNLYLYDNLDERVATVSDLNFNNDIDWAGPDLVSSNATRYVSIDGDWWRETRQWSIHDDDSAEARLMAVHRTRVTGLGFDGLASESVSIDRRGNATTNRVWRYRDNALEISETKYPTAQIAALSVVSNNLATMSVSQTGVTNTFAYDALNRQIAATDGRGNTTQTVYDSLGRVASTIDALGYATTYGYDSLGRRVSTTDPLTNTVYTAYDAEGHVVSQRGGTYPVAYSYDEFGDKVSMTTYRDLSGERETGNGEPVSGALEGDVTTWLRDEATGLVTNKVYADGKGPSYTYTPDGKLETRTWARGIVTTYSYDDNGSLTNTVYSDSTPTISLAYNRAGRQVHAIDAAGVTTFEYNDYGQCAVETTCIDGEVAVATNTIERFYDSYGRNAGYALNGVRQSTLGYDPANGRLSTMQIPEAEESNLHSPTPTQNSNFFTWSYLPGSDLKSSLAYPNGLTATWSYDANNQLLQVCNATSTNVISQYDYVYDAAGRRVQIGRSGSAMSETRTDYYDYNERGELISDAKNAKDVENVEYAYEYDDIGNRISSLDLGTNRTYIANSLNQYVSISNLCASASQREEFLPQFDDDGNQTLIQTATGIWSVTYNGENRPVLWESVSTNSQLTTHNSQLFIWDPTESVATRPLVFKCGVIPVWIEVNSYLPEQQSKGTYSGYWNHIVDVNKNSDYEVSNGCGESNCGHTRGLVIANERGHARAYFELVKPWVDSMSRYLDSFDNKNPDELMEMAQEYYDLMARGRVYNQKSADYSNAATHGWYKDNGYDLVSEENGRYFRYVKAR